MEMFTLCIFNIERQISISNGIIQYYQLASNLTPSGHQPRSDIQSYSKFYEMYLFSFLSMKEQGINSLRLVEKCGQSCYSPSVVQITLGSASCDLDD